MKTILTILSSNDNTIRNIASMIAVPIAYAIYSFFKNKKNDKNEN